MECQLKQLVINTERVRIELNARFPQNLEESKEEDVRQYSEECGEVLGVCRVHKRYTTPRPPLWKFRTTRRMGQAN